MPGETHNGMQCNEFEALLFDALDQKLGAADQERFRAHARVCGKCGPMFAEVEAGQHWLESLAEGEAPAHPVKHILAATHGTPELPAAGSGSGRTSGIAGRENPRMGGFPVRTRLGYSAAAEVCNVVRHGIFLLVGCAERGRGEADRYQVSRSEPEWFAPDVLHHHGP